MPSTVARIRVYLAKADSIEMKTFRLIPKGHFGSGLSSKKESRRLMSMMHATLITRQVISIDHQSMTSRRYRRRTRKYKDRFEGWHGNTDFSACKSVVLARNNALVLSMFLERWKAGGSLTTAGARGWDSRSLEDISR